MQREPKTKIWDVLVAKQHHKTWLRIASAMMAVVVFCTTYALILPAITMENKAYCGKEEHTHTDSCYTMQAVPKLVFTCSPEDDADFILHTHDEACYDDAGQLICTLTERQIHTHDESCYDENGELICDNPEVREHIHDEVCYDENDTLICGQPQIVTHQHSTECFEETSVTEDVPVLTCTLEEHTHTDQCFVEPESLTFTYSDDSVSGIITIPWSEQLPDDLSCTVVLLSEDDEDYESMRAGANQALVKENMYNADLSIYQLDWQSAGKSYTLPEDIVPTVELVAKDLAEDETFAGVILEVSEGDADVQQDTASGNSAITIDPPEEFDSVEIETDNSTDAIPTDTTSMHHTDSVVETSAESTAASLDNANAGISLASLDDDDDEDLGSQTYYSATSVAADDDTVTLSMQAAAATFAVARTRALPTGTAYYKRVDSLSEMQNADGSSDSSGIYVIVSADGTLALGNNTVKITNNYGGKTSTYADWNYQQVTVSPVRDADNNEYFVIHGDGSYLSPGNNKTLHWNFYDYQNKSQKDEYYWATKPYFLIGNYGTGGYLWLGYDQYELKSAAYRYYWSIGMMLNRNETEQTWQITANADRLSDYSYQDTWYLTYDRTDDTDLSTGYITQHNQDDHGSTYNQTWYDCDFQDNFMIYKYVGTDLTVYDDEGTAAEVKKTTDEENGDLQEATKPTTLGTETTTAAAKQGEETSTSVLTGATFTYASDKATSSIEEQFLLNDSNLSDYDLHTQQAKNDGRIVTDKSVIYRDDDYGAFDSYEEDEFSVTLSALGQEWTIQEQEETTTPMDVVFVLDLSSSMKTEYNSVPRWMSSINALNTISNEILSRDEDNRVGLVAFSTGAVSALSLDHYDTSASENEKLLNYGSSYYSVATSSGLCDSSGTTVHSVSLGSSGTGLWKQTFTQLGLQYAYNLFDAVGDDTTVVRTNADGKEQTVKRQPVIILLSDGEPTLGSYDYMNPSAGPVYGFGLGDQVFGYYSVLSANYFKNMTSIKYSQTAKFFSLGLGIGDDTSWAKFMRAVLDPTETRLEDLQNYKYHTLADMLLDQSDGTYLSSSRYYNGALRQFDELYRWGYTNDVITANPSLGYSNYSYADDAFFGEFTEDELTQILESILNRVQQVNNYGFLLAEGTSLDMTDRIGDGMAVKDAPVLRYFGEDSGTRKSTNYTVTGSQTGTDDTGFFTQYIYDYQVTRQANDVKDDEENTIDLSQIVVKVYDATATRGELVKLSIPEDAVPTFYPDLHKQFYYEELPVRLIYKVGLSADTKSTLLKLSAFATQSYYTNAYTASGAKVTTATFTPGANNPYYNIDTTTSRSKTANTTGTYSKYFEEYVSDATTGTVTQRLGNNGKLTVARDGVLVVSKEWDGLSPSETDGKYLSAWVYREKQYEDGRTDDLEFVDTLSLSKSRNWFSTIQPEAGGTDGNGDYVWQYYVTENLAFLNAYGVSYTDAEGNLLDYVIRYNVPNADGSSYSINMLRLYPLDDSVTITNRSKTLTINKVWADDTADNQTVQVQIYRAKTPLNGTNVKTTYELVATKDVSPGSPLTYTATSYGLDYNLNAFYYDYYVAEVPVTGYAATYTDTDGNPISPLKIQVDGTNVTVYPAVKNITITNTKKVSQTVVTKTWGDGYDAHDGQGVYVGLFAKVLRESTVTDPDTGAVTTELAEEYLLKQNRYLTKDNDWSVTWRTNDVGTTYYAGANNVKYTIEGYYVAEYLYTTSGYAPVYYRMDEDEMVRTDSVVTISSYTTIIGDATTVVTDGTATPNIARYYTAQLAQPTALYPADESVIIQNVPENQLTVTKTWADGLTPEPVIVGIYPIAYDSDNDIVRSYRSTQELTDYVAYAGLSEDFQWTVTLSEENNWTYTWTDLPMSVVLRDPDTDEDVTYHFTYCVYEYQNDDEPYLPVYYDGNHELITNTITDFEGIPIHAAYRPDDGIVNIENEIQHSDLVINKQWAGVEEDDQMPVTVNLYREMLDAEGNVVEKATLFDRVQLSADNDWAATVRDLPYYKMEGTGSDKKVYTYRYYVGEVQSDTTYTVTYSVNPALEEEPTMTTMSDGQIACYVKFDASSANYEPTYTVTVINAKGYTPPHAGGIGTHWYTWSGAAILLAVCALYILIRHRQRNRGKGGEYVRPIS